ncbi:poly(3-hydroxybutyrate) depolymerase [Beggiatoa alba B18LD]|uniref:Poly(3-hydroxybutyrate) depolymerase n=1 Tax=Beggiatoa alba B18LD TaxID=395493 RepID=I3CGP7_9GAMM|nr:poly(3-hydroxybutyrate) depolymerase [Beggiatoa alba]EIJ42790.1 poly(3-hydroxybutyrate) depolymerase [Beggiatoa alba B18LD]
MMFPSKKLTITGLLVALFYQAPAFAEDKLAGYDADLSQTTVSGISSGGFMSAQLATAYSSLIKGAGIVAGGPFYCSGSTGARTAMDFINSSISTCMGPATSAVAPKADKALKKAKELATAGKIDSVDNLKTQKIYIFTGSSDTVVKPIVVEQTYKFYQLAEVPADNIKFVNTVNSGHALITGSAEDAACPTNVPPFINNCGFFQSTDILTHLYGKLNPAAEIGKLSGKIVAFNQSEFVDSDRSSMSSAAYAYIPKSCETSKCKVHIALHGCFQGAHEVNDVYYTHTRYNEIADTNNLIVLYPQAQVSKEIPLNPMGCWDFWGYSSKDQNSPDFYSHDAPQMKAIMKMVSRLGEPRAAH